MGEYLDHAKRRVQSLLKEIDRLLEGEFPYVHSRDGIKKLKEIFDADLATLNSFDSGNDPQVVKQTCALALVNLFRYLPLVGFLLRSTNVRNAFESFGPLLRLARDVLEPSKAIPDRTTRLILSSEWEYSPHIYNEIPRLPGFVLIGLPASESDNPLLLPLAGHELGHSIWGSSSAATVQVFKKLQAAVFASAKANIAELNNVFPATQPLTPAEVDTNIFCIRFLQPAVLWARKQAEETFCDNMGVRLFGSAYLHAFAYLLSPGMDQSRAFTYPSMKSRIAGMLQCAAQFGVAQPAGYIDQFDDDPPANISPSDAFRLSLADQAVDNLRPELIAFADNVFTQAGLSPPDDAEQQRILKRFEKLVPAENCKSLSDILNAAWLASNCDTLWAALAFTQTERQRILDDLVLKNLELLEMETILADVS